jgi:hypothetical protein
MNNFRLYTFINFYLSSIQQGIQTAHIVSEMMSKDLTDNQYDSLNQWATKDKTIIVLNGGTSFDLRQDYITVLHACEQLGDECYLPHAFFTEDHNALGAWDNGVVTGWGIIVPQFMWDAKLVVPEYKQVGVYGLSVNDIQKTYPEHYSYTNNDTQNVETYKFDISSPEGKIIQLLQSKGLAR